LWGKKWSDHKILLIPRNKGNVMLGGDGFWNSTAMGTERYGQTPFLTMAQADPKKARLPSSQIDHFFTCNFPKMCHSSRSMITTDPVAIADPFSTGVPRKGDGLVALSAGRGSR